MRRCYEGPIGLIDQLAYTKMAAKKAQHQRGYQGQKISSIGQGFLEIPAIGLQKFKREAIYIKVDYKTRGASTCVNILAKNSLRTYVQIKHSNDTR